MLNIDGLLNKKVKITGTNQNGGCIGIAQGTVRGACLAMDMKLIIEVFETNKLELYSMQSTYRFFVIDFWEQ